MVCFSKNKLYSTYKKRISYLLNDVCGGIKCLTISSMKYLFFLTTNKLIILRDCVLKDKDSIFRVKSCISGFPENEEAHKLMFRYLKQELLIKQNNNINIKATPKKEGNYNQNLTRINKNSPFSIELHE